MSRSRGESGGKDPNPSLRDALEKVLGPAFLNKVTVYSKVPSTAPMPSKLGPSPDKELDESRRRARTPASAKAIRGVRDPKGDSKKAQRVEKAAKRKTGKVEQRKKQATQRHKAVHRSLPPMPHNRPSFSKQRLKGQASNADARLQFNKRVQLTAGNALETSGSAIDKITFEELRAEWTKLVGQQLHFGEAELQSCAKLISKISEIEVEWARRQTLMPSDAGYFKWPSTSAVPGSGHVIAGAWSATGMLGYLGYHVGKSCTLKPEHRQRLLAHIFEMSLPPLESAEYMAEWSIRSTPERLKKMADCIASFTRLAKCQRLDAKAMAIRDWEGDLVYLKRRFYVGKFHWPSTT